ncbi:MAG: 3'-5' exonuclease [Betaproteobacteria bacterium]|nr:3'-5' exonuclease [Betaproteobacteria bacterium]MCL4699907.1 3'-5' exonuclease [Burkholderiaceae bacterium]
MGLRSWFTRAAPFDEARWVVLDVEASGLDAAHDRLLAIAAIAVRWPGGEAVPRIELGDSFEVVLRQDESAPLDKPNILIHGIGVGAQRAGVAPREGLAAFSDWAGASPLIAFHAAFDETMIRRALRSASLPALRGPWVDLAPVAEVARPDVAAKSLDEWLSHFAIEVAVRHQAAADTLATAELMLRLWPAIVAQHAGAGFRGLVELAAQRRWLKPG